MGVSTINVGQKSVILVDVSNLTNEQLDEISSTLKAGNALVKTKPEKSVYIITNVTGTRFNGDVTEAFKAYAAANTVHIKESVLVGLSGLQMVVFSAIKAMTKREYKIVSTIDEAKAYLEKCE